MLTKLVIRVSGHMVKFIDGDQAIVKRLYTVGIDREAKGCVCTNKHLVATFKKRAERFYLAAVVVTGGVAQIPLRFNMPISPESKLR